MSYNYLPLDHKWLHFEQVENLLQYQQLLSITFTAHEHITTNQNFVPTLTNNHHFFTNTIGTTSKSASIFTGNSNLLRLMIAFKIKSLSYGKSGVSIETVKQLLHLYNHNIIPVTPILHASENTTALTALLQTIKGEGNVLMAGKLMQATAAFEAAGIQPLILQPIEEQAIFSGNQYTTAFAFYVLQQAKKINALCTHGFAYSMNMVQANRYMLHEKVNLERKDNNYQNVANVLKQLVIEHSIGKVDVPAFNNCVHVLSNAETALQNCIDVWMQEVNIPSEQFVVNADGTSFIQNTNSYLPALHNHLQLLYLQLNHLFQTISSLNEWLCSYSKTVIAFNDILPEEKVYTENIESLLEKLFTTIAIQLQLLVNIQQQHTNNTVQLPFLLQETSTFKHSLNNLIEVKNLQPIKDWLKNTTIEELVYS